MRLSLSIAALLTVCASPAVASPATDFLASVRENIDARYYAKPGVDVRAIFDAAEARLAQACAAQRDACPQDLGVAEAREAVQALGDAHTRLEQSAPSAGPALGGPAAQLAPLGWMIKKERDGDGLYVAWVAPGGPAEKAGVQRHDVLVAPAGMSAAALTASVEAGRYTLSRGGRTFDVALTPQPGAPRPMPRLDRVGDAAVLHVPAGVGDGMAQTAHDLIAKAKADGARALILDLRDNGGGGIQCAAMASAFIDYSIVQSDPQGGRRVLSVTPGRARVVADGEDDIEELIVERPSRWDGPMAVLVNDNTGSCAEAVAIQAGLAGRARIIGEPSVGVGNNVVMGFPVSTGWRLVMTIAYSTTPDGKPLPPRPPLDVKIADDPSAIARTGRDSVLEAALRDLEATGAS